MRLDSGRQSFSGCLADSKTLRPSASLRLFRLSFTESFRRRANLNFGRLLWIALLVGTATVTFAEGKRSGDAIDARPAGTATAEAPATWGDWPRWGDQGDGNYRNPVLPGDFSDIDCIRVGSDYYAISSTFQYSPGMVILHSRDLVNWRILGHVISDVTQIGPELNWNRMNRYGRGVWAGAIRFHAGKFWVYFGTPEEGYFMSTATDPAGPWTPLHQMTKEAGWDDCCPFWDDDGQGYFVGTHFRDGYKTWLYKLTPDGRNLIPDSRVLLNEGSGREASKLYKINGTYYHFYSEHKPGVGRYVMMQRATNIAGPYLEKRQLSHVQREAHEPNQGGIVQTEQGDWYFFTHHGSGDWEGRPASLLPVTWVDGWPVLGAVGSDCLGTMVWSGRKPVLNTPMVTPQTDDDFSGPKLGVQWEWNYQPRAEKWSLIERPGWLRLHAWKPLRPDNLKTAGNTLTQRTLRTKRNVVTVQLDPAGMADGQVAGLCHYNRNYATIAVRRENGELVIEAARNQTIVPGPRVEAKLLWLRTEWGLDGVSRFSYSTDGKNFVTLGDSYPFAWGDYRGERVGLFSYNNQGEAGHADFGAFTYHFDSPLTR
jgi:beta-xylosidase